MLHIFFEEQAHDAHGNHRDEDVEHIARLVVDLELEESLEYPGNLLPEDDEGTQYCSHVYGDGERQVLLGLDAKEG